jgi:thymidine kinase
MFSGKTTELMRLGRQYIHAKKKCLYLKHSKDMRYSPDNSLLINHNQDAISAVPVDELVIQSDYDKYDVILIDEGQFFKDLSLFCNHYADTGKVVIVSALNARSNRKPWEEISNLVACATIIHHLRAVCVDCGKSAEYTHCLHGNTGEVLEGGSETYEPLCRPCYVKKNKTVLFVQ